jgi:hypothetical protein
VEEEVPNARKAPSRNCPDDLDEKRRNGTVRRAIYTRKSSDEELEQEFNSLQAQREAREAFITSQRHEVGVRLPASYDDGGFSGATLDRPAVQQLPASGITRPGPSPAGDGSAGLVV